MRVAQKRIDPQSGEEVPYEEIVKGYEIAPERYVVIEPAELDTLEPAKTRTIDLEDFVELSQIDPIFYEHPYYLVPGPGGAKPYRLLLEAMRETSKVAIARVVMRSKEQLVAIRPVGDVLEMDTMLFADEVLPPERLDELPDPSEITTTKREREIARPARRLARRRLSAREVPRQLPRKGARADRAEGPGQGDRRAAPRRGDRHRRPRSDGRAQGQSRRCARAHGRRRQPAKPPASPPARPPPGRPPPRGKPAKRPSAKKPAAKSGASRPDKP